MQFQADGRPAYSGMIDSWIVNKFGGNAQAWAWWLAVKVGDGDGATAALANYTGEVVTAKKFLPDPVAEPASKLNIVDGAIHYFLYRQDGTKQPMTCRDTPDARQTVEWFQIHDRYAPGGTS